MREARRPSRSGRERLVAASRELFSTRWYETVSVAEICRAAGLTNPAFYRHFKDKEELFLQFLEDFLGRFSARLGRPRGEGPRERLGWFYGELLGTAADSAAEIEIFREGEFRFPAYERRLRDIYLEALARVLGRPASEAEYLYLVGGIRFLVRRPAFGEAGVGTEDLVDVALRGCLSAPPDGGRAGLGEPRAATATAGGVGAQPPPAAAARAAPPPDTRSRLIAAGRSLFGATGYHAVKVFEIAQAAGCSVGAFYLSFKTKEDFLVEVVRDISRSLRKHIAQRIDPGAPATAVILQGYASFLDFIAAHPEYYEIIREAEFSGTGAAGEYYDILEGGYVGRVSALRHADPRVTAGWIMGIGHHLGIDRSLIRSFDDPRPILAELGGLLERGLGRPL